jgi:hypothetical protein
MNDWAVIKNQATKSLIAETIWKSFVKERLYKIIKVDNSRLIIARMSGGENASFTKGEALRAIDQLRTKSRVKRSHLIHSVLRETMLIHLHPSVYLDETSREIYWHESAPLSLQSTKSYIENAPDDEIEKIQALINQRKNQSKFRKNLFHIYQAKCAISGVSAPQALIAAHILNHAASGINSNDNGILLRSDLHDLFDAGLLKIHPMSLTVHLDPSLCDSYYSQYNGLKLASRIDNSSPSEIYLNAKWNETKDSKVS